MAHEAGFDSLQGAKYFSILNKVCKDSGVHSVPYLIGTGDYFPWIKAAGADKGFHEVSVTDPYRRILGFLNRSLYFSFQLAPQL
jgi:hypothetical protein